MTKEEKALYEKVKAKTRQQIKRRVRAVFTDHHAKLKNFDSKKATMLGDLITILEMEIKAVL